MGNDVSDKESWEALQGFAGKGINFLNHRIDFQNRKSKYTIAMYKIQIKLCDIKKKKQN